MTNAEKEKKSKPSAPSFDVHDLYLHEIAFRRVGGEAPDELNTPLNFDMALRRENVDALGVQLGLTAKAEGVFDARIVYRVEFGTAEGAETPSDDVWRQVAARMAPVILYPYMRETLSALILKAGYPQAILPVLNVGQMWSPDEVNLPDPAKSSD